MILKSPKHVFWEAFLIAVIIFIFGFLLGYAFEIRNMDKIENYYMQSEISLVDTLALDNLINSNQSSCNDLVLANLKFADKIYNEALILEKYEDAGKVSETMKYTHMKYDLLRTFLWMNAAKTKDKCGNFNYVVYLYEYNTKDLVDKAEYRTWSKILFDLKQAQGANVILIPIAVDNNLISLNSLKEQFNINEYPVVIINDDDVLNDITGVDDITKYLD